MGNYFLDTSALVKRYHLEVGEGTERRAIELLSSYALKQGLRTLDALQLAAALDIKEKDGLSGFR